MPKEKSMQKSNRFQIAFATIAQVPSDAISPQLMKWLQQYAWFVNTMVSGEFFILSEAIRQISVQLNSKPFQAKYSKVFAEAIELHTAVKNCYCIHVVILPKKSKRKK